MHIFSLPIQEKRGSSTGQRNGLDVSGLIPTSDKEKSVSLDASLCVICRDDMNTVRRSLDWDF